jgi:hypothetical protein
MRNRIHLFVQAPWQWLLFLGRSAATKKICRTSVRRNDVAQRKNDGHKKNQQASC